MFALIEHGTDVVYEAVNSGNFSEFTSAMFAFGCLEGFKKVIGMIKHKHSNNHQNTN